MQSSIFTYFPNRSLHERPSSHPECENHEQSLSVTTDSDGCVWPQMMQRFDLGPCLIIMSPVLQQGCVLHDIRTYYLETFVALLLGY